MNHRYLMEDELTGYEEHEAYEMGRYANDFQAAYDHARLTIERPNEQSKVDALVAEGKFVVVCRYAMYCPHTDAILGEAKVIASVHDTYAAAEAAMPPYEEQDSDHCYYLESLDCIQLALDANLYVAFRQVRETLDSGGFIDHPKFLLSIHTTYAAASDAIQGPDGEQIDFTGVLFPANHPPTPNRYRITGADEDIPF